jgi:hypothetical protein
MRLIGYISVSCVGGRDGESFISPKEQRGEDRGYDTTEEGSSLPPEAAGGRRRAGPTGPLFVCG